MCCRVDPAKPTDPLRDRFILSKGHAAAALYAALAFNGFFPSRSCSTPIARTAAGSPNIRRRTCCRASKPPPARWATGCRSAVGMALAGRIKGETFRVFALLSDGENNEGSVWEAAMFAAAQKLENVCVVVDYNKWQATARSNETLDAGATARQMGGVRLGRA